MKSNQLFDLFFNHNEMNPMLAKDFLTPKVKNIVFVLLIITLLVTNLASLLSWRAHEVMYSMLSKTVSVFGGDDTSQKVLFNSPKVQLELKVERRTKELSTQVAQFKTANEKLKTDLFELNKTMSSHKLKAKSAIELIHKRIQKNIARNVAALPSEAIPAISLATSVAVTAMDILDACETMNDFNNVLVGMGQAVTTTGVCNLSIPTTTSVMTVLKTNWQSSAKTIAKEATNYKLPSFNVTFPTISDIKNVTCSAYKVVLLC